MKKYQDIYPSEPILNSKELDPNLASDLLTLEYFEAEPSTMPAEVFDQHHILINLNENAHRVENWRGEEYRDFTFQQGEIVVTPAGMKSGWKWHEKSKVIVITLDPERFNEFAQNEVGVVLSDRQLSDVPQFKDEDLCQAAEFVYESLDSKKLGFEVMFESLARVFLVKLIQKYGEAEELDFGVGFSSNQYKRVLDFIKANFGDSISLEDLANQAGI
ncbi:MAG: AraC family transcriptional regulator, partial [Pseudomonadota bacterium]